MSEDEIYGSVLRMVLWGESKEEVFHKLAVNGILGTRAEELYRRAVRERVAVIRGPNWKRMMWGATILLLSLALFCFLWFYVGAVTQQLLLICAAGGAVGAWKLLVGVSKILGAAHKQGSIDD